MANKKMKFSDNVPGPYYVDVKCIACHLCVQIAPKNFKMKSGYAYVYKQPENDVEKKLCDDAVLVCPVDAIGNDGQTNKPDTEL